jgi:catechol 2,3-dioxygenase-like lactoylglutathione lyase family enzyme
VALRTPNYEEMIRFYTETLGFPIVRRWDHRNIVFIDIGSTTIELLGRQDATMETNPTGGWDHVALLVESVDDAHAELAAKGVRFRSGPTDAGDVRLAFFFDPDGNVLELFEEKN